MKKTDLLKSNDALFGKISNLLNEARKYIVISINHTIVLTYFEIGRLIVEEEQEGKERAEYGKSVLKELSQRLTKKFGKGYSVYNLERMRKFYFTYKDRMAGTAKSASPLRKFESPFKLSWSHYLQLLKIEKVEEMLHKYNCI